MTVSRALRGHGSIRPETRQKVLDIAAALGYNRLSGVVFPRNGRAERRLKLLLPIFGGLAAMEKSELYQRFYRGLNERLRESGGSVIVVECAGLPDLLQAVRDHQPRGVVTRQILQRDWLRAVKMLCPVVSSIADDFLLGFDCVYMNENRAATLALTRLWEQGHRRIAWFGLRDIEAPTSPVARLWMEADLYQLRDLSDVHEIRYSIWSYLVSRFADHPMKLLLPERNHLSQPMEEVIREGVDTLLAGTPVTTAVVTASDMMGYYLVKELQARGRRVPEDCSVLTYGDTSLATKSTPRLCAIRVPLDEVGRSVPELIERRLAHPDARPISIALEPVFVEGASIAPPPMLMA